MSDKENVRQSRVETGEEKKERDERRLTRTKKKKYLTGTKIVNHKERKNHEH